MGCWWWCWWCGGGVRGQRLEACHAHAGDPFLPTRVTQNQCDLFRCAGAHISSPSSCLPPPRPCPPSAAAAAVCHVSLVAQGSGAGLPAPAPRPAAGHSSSTAAAAQQQQQRCERAEAMCMAASMRRSHLWPCRLAVTGGRLRSWPPRSSTRSPKPTQEAAAAAAHRGRGKARRPRLVVSRRLMINHALPATVLFLPDCTGRRDVSHLRAWPPGSMLTNPVFAPGSTTATAQHLRPRGAVGQNRGPPWPSPPSRTPSRQRPAISLARKEEGQETVVFAALYGLARVWSLMLSDKKAEVVGQGRVGELVALVLRGRLTLRGAAQASSPPRTASNLKGPVEGEWASRSSSDSSVRQRASNRKASWCHREGRVSW